MLTRLEKGSTTYAVYDIKCEMSSLDNVSIQMINSNQKTNIGIAPIIYESTNDECEKILFDVTGKVTLQEYITKKISQNEFKNMLINLIETIEGFDEYMIDTKQIMLDIQYVYVNEVSKTVTFICLPLKDKENETKLYEFFKKVVETSYVEWDASQVSYFNSVYNVVKNENGFSLDNMRSAMNMAAGDNKNIKPAEPLVKAPAQNFQQPQQPQQNMQPQGNSFQPTNTVVIPNEPAKQPDVPQMNIPLPQGNDEKKSGLFGKFFGGSGKKTKGSGKASKNAPVEENPDAIPSKGLSSLRKSAGKKDKNAPAPSIPQVNFPNNNQAAQAPQPQLQPSAQGFQNNATSPAAMSAFNNSPLGKSFNNAPANNAPVNGGFSPSPLSGGFNSSSTGAGFNSAPANNGFNSAPANFNNQPVNNGFNSAVPMNAVGNDSGFKAGMNDGSGWNEPPQKPISSQSIIKLQSGLAQNNASSDRLDLNMDQPPVSSKEDDYIGTTLLYSGSGDTTLLKNDSPDTTSLKDKPPIRAFLVRRNNRQNYEITKSVFGIGRDRKDQDLCINDNTAIGHKHAYIIRKNVTFFIVDNNSMNHTFVNGNQIDPNVEVRLNNGDKIVFADEEFDFRIF